MGQRVTAQKPCDAARRAAALTPDVGKQRANVGKRWVTRK